MTGLRGCFESGTRSAAFTLPEGIRLADNALRIILRSRQPLTFHARSSTDGDHDILALGLGGLYVGCLLL
jgi:hypothetical protein